jgi:hypothetical protein
MFCRSLFVHFYFFFWPLCCLFFFDMRILIAPLVSSNSSCRYSSLVKQLQDNFYSKFATTLRYWTKYGIYQYMLFSLNFGWKRTLLEEIVIVFIPGRVVLIVLETSWFFVHILSLIMVGSHHIKDEMHI